MRVFVLTRRHDDSPSVIGVFTTEARAHAARHGNSLQLGAGVFSIVEKEVDSNEWNGSPIERPDSRQEAARG